MRLGFVLPHIGPWAGPDALAQVASRAEELGFDSVWTTERLLVPLEPSAPYPVGDGRIPEVYKTTLDALDSLTFVAGQTSRIRLGVSVLNLPWYNPPLLARRLTTIDVLSEGRLNVGFGIGWSPEEYKAVGSDWNVRGKRFAEALQALKTIWTTDPVEFHGEFFDIPRSVIGPKPVQKPHPPIYMAAYTPPALERVARDSNGWNPVGIPPAAVAQMFEGIKETARQAGRDPSELELVMRANVELTETPLGDDRGPFCGTTDQIAADIAETKEIGATQLFFDPSFDPTVRSLDDYISRIELYAEIAREAYLPVVPER
jgi:probable F420-dependent oxidoreductase